MARYPPLATGLLLWLSALAGLSVSQDWTLDPQKDLGQMSNYMLTVVNNTIYTIGGTAFYWAPQSVYSSVQSRNNNSAYIIKTSNSYLRALDLSKPMDLEPQFSDQSEIISELPFEIPHVKRGAFWADGDVAYYWGGELEADPVFQYGAFQNRTREWPDPMKYYTYDLRQPKGLGTWETVSILTGSGSDKLTTSPASGGYAYSAEAGKMFYLGGFMSRAVGKNKDGSNATRAGINSYPVSGMIVFDLETKLWRNETTATEWNELNDMKEGQMVYVKGVGESGILVMVGGNNWANTLYAFDSVYVYDIAAKIWYHQTTTSKAKTFPERRQGPFCAGAVAAPDKSSFAIYVYGGSNNGDMVKGTWALTMPYFQWLQVIGGRMAMVRGRADVVELMDENGGTYFYDMTNQTWTHVYTPGEYTVPKVIYDVIGGNAQGGAHVTGPYNDRDFPNGLGRLFSAAAAMASASGSSTPRPSTLPGDSTKSDTAAIAGGTVGGVAGLALLGAGVWIFSRRRRRSVDMAMQGGTTVGNQESSFIGGVHNHPLTPGCGESGAPGRYGIPSVPVELPAHELGGSA